MGGGGLFLIFHKNRPQKHQKRAISHTSQANEGGLEPPRPPGYATGWTDYSTVPGPVANFWRASPTSLN